MRKVILTFTFFAVVSSLYAQREKIEIDKNYSVAKIYFKDNSIKKVRDFKVNSNGLANYVEIDNGKSSSDSISDLRLLKVKTGSHALAYGLYGAGVMALSSIYAAAEIANDPFLEPKDNAGSIYAGFIIGGAAIGAIVGAASPKWKTISINLKNINEPLTYTFYPSYSSTNQSVLLNLNVTF